MLLLFCIFSYLADLYFGPDDVRVRVRLGKIHLYRIVYL